MENWRKYRNSRCVASAGNRRNELTAQRERDGEREREREREGESVLVPFRVLDAIAVVVVVVVVNKSKVGISLCQPKSRQRILAAAPEQRVGSVRSAAKTKRRAIGCPCPLPSPPPPSSLSSPFPCLSSTAHSAQLSPVWATVLLGKFVILPNFSCGASARRGWGGRGTATSINCSTTKWMNVSNGTICVEDRGEGQRERASEKLENFTVNWIKLSKL